MCDGGWNYSHLQLSLSLQLDRVRCPHCLCELRKGIYTVEAGQTGMGVATFQVASAVSNYQDHLKGRYHNWLESSEIRTVYNITFSNLCSPQAPR